MAWKIYKDYLQLDREGVSEGELSGETFQALVLDDDNELYYAVRFDKGAWMEELEELWEWAMDDVGATQVAVHIDTIAKLDPGSLDLFRERLMWKSGKYRGWCTLFA